MLMSAAAMSVPALLSAVEKSSSTSLKLESASSRLISASMGPDWGQLDFFEQLAGRTAVGLSAASAPYHARASSISVLWTDQLNRWRRMDESDGSAVSFTQGAAWELTIAPLADEVVVLRDAWRVFLQASGEGNLRLGVGGYLGIVTGCAIDWRRLFLDRRRDLGWRLVSFLGGNRCVIASRDRGVV